MAAYILQAFKGDALQSPLNQGATSGTLTSGAFGSPTGPQLLVIDPEIPAKREIIRATISGTALTGITRGLDGTADVDHAANAPVIMAFVPSHYANGLGAIAANDAWTAWTSTWTATSGTAPSLGNGTLSGRYQQIGKTVKGNLIFNPGTTTTFGNAGVWEFTLPVAPKQNATDATTIGTLHILDAGTQHYTGVAQIPNGSTVMRLINHGNTGSGITHNLPMVWVDADSFTVVFEYEAA